MILCFPSQKLNTSSLKKIKERHINKCPTKSSSFPRFFFLSPGVQFDKPANINASIKLFHSQNRSRIPPNTFTVILNAIEIANYDLSDKCTSH